MLNHTLIIVIGIFLFALVTAGLYAVGLRKKVTENERMTGMLLNNAALRVVKYLKEHDTVTADGIGFLIKEVKAKEFYSKKTAVIVNGEPFRDKLIDYMLRGKHIVRVRENGKTLYKLPPAGK